jgi:hypothetical protein
VKFARHLAAAVLVVAVIVTLGVAWAHSPAASWLGAGRGRPGGPGGHVVSVVPAGIRKLSGDHRPAGTRSLALNPSDLKDLVRTVVIEAAFIAVVVAIDVIRRRQRRARRSATQPLTR